MRMAYLILAHDNPAHLDALLERLVPAGSPDVAIVHADRRSALWPALRQRWPSDSERIRLIREPVAVRWGHASQVEAIALLVGAAVQAKCDYAHLISGVDWPAATRERIVADIHAEAHLQCYIEAVPGAMEWRMQGRRLDTRWLRVDPTRNNLAYGVCWELRRVSRWIESAGNLLGKQRTRPYGAWYKGATWWSLPRDALLVACDEIERLLASGRLSGTVCADEHVVPTIIGSRFPDRIADNRRFIVFPRDQSSPSVLDRSHLPAIRQSGAWFIRKVSAEHDAFFRELP